MFKDSVDSSRPPSELGVQESGRANPNVLSKSGQEKNPGKIRSRVRRALLALFAVATLATAQGNQARAAGIAPNDAELAALQEGFGNAAAAEKKKSAALRNANVELCLELDDLIGDDKSGWSLVDEETRKICDKLLK